TVLTPDKQIFKGPIVSIKVPGTNGQFQVLKNHAPIVSSLSEGNIEIVTSSGEYEFYNEETSSIETAEATGAKISYQIKGGFIEVLNNEVSLLAQLQS
ncbi:MAG: F0F1 ATP synthase subunit epsilon, partial [Bacteroidota bacterium]